MKPIHKKKSRIFKTDMEVYKYALCVLIWSIFLLDENMLSFSLKTYEGDIYNNTVILIFSGGCASYLAYFLIDRFDPSLALSFSFSIMAIAGFMYP